MIKRIAQTINEANFVLEQGGGTGEGDDIDWPIDYNELGQVTSTSQEEIDANYMENAIALDPELSHAWWYPPFMLPFTTVTDENGNQVLNDTAQEIWDGLWEAYPTLMDLLVNTVASTFGDVTNPENQLAIIRFLFNPHVASRWATGSKDHQQFMLSLREWMMNNFLDEFGMSFFQNLFPDINFTVTTGTNPIPSGPEFKYQPGIDENNPETSKWIRFFRSIGSGSVGAGGR